MSKTIDQRVVEMQFNNKQFETNVKTTMSTLDNLKQSLNLTGASKGLENVGTAAKNVDMSGLSGAIDTVRIRFSALEAIAITALANITNSAINAGKRIVSALTIEPISEGFAEYELKMGSIQTIMAGTGESLETVNKYLDELNVYADRTIYSFADMTSNIGKFTNAGVSLKDSVAAIQGVSNVAAVSGANANEASRAMYNFAQALSAGHVKLIDWKSIEVANMATVEFKTQLLESAVAAGTVAKTADGMYKVLSRNNKGKFMDDVAIDATRNFNESLSYQWMTTEVLVETLGKYADETTDIGKKAFAAAQDIKTVTQLFDTLKEAAGSGWAQTWEILIGDFEEAKKILTELGGVIGGFIDRTSDARNELLRLWKENGGRETLIEAFRNSFEALGKIIKPISEAFRDIFPPTTSEQLLNLTNGLKTFTERLKIGDETADKIKRTFAGVFAAIDLVISGFKFLFGVAGEIAGVFAPVGDGLLGFTAAIGDFIVSLRDGASAGDIFKNGIEGLHTLLEGVADGVQAAVEKITHWFGQFGGIDLGPLQVFSDKTKVLFKPFTFLVETVGKAISGIKKAVEFLAPYFQGAFEKAGEVIAKALETMGFDSLSDAFTALLQGGFVVGLISLSNALLSFSKSTHTLVVNAKNIFGNIGGFANDIKEILDGVSGSLAAMQSQLKSKALMNIAIAVAVLAGALWVLSTIPVDELTPALGVVTVLFIELSTAMAALTKTNGAFKMGAVSTQMVAMATAILILSVALKQLAGIDYEGLAKGTAGIGTLMFMLVTASKSLSKVSGPLAKGSVGMIAFATALLILTQAVKQLGALDYEELNKGLLGVGVMLGELVIFMKLMPSDKKMMAFGLSLIPLATGLLILTQAVKSMSNLSWEELSKGLIGVGVALTMIAAVTKLVKPSEMLAMGAAMIPIGVGLNMLALSLSVIGGMSWESLAKGLIGLAGALAILAGAMKLMSGSIVGAAALTVMAIGIGLLVPSLLLLSLMDLESIGTMLLALGGALAILAGAMKLMSGGIAGAASLTVMAVALGLLVPSLLLLGTMDLKNIAMMLLALVGVFGIFAAAAALLTPIIPSMLGLAGAIALLGVGVLALGAGLTLLTAACVAFAVGRTAMAAGLTLIVKTLIGLIPMAVKAVGEALLSLLSTIVTAIPLIVEAVRLFLEGIIMVLIEQIPPLMVAVGVLLDAVIQRLIEDAPKIVEAVVIILITVLNTLAEHADELVLAALNLVASFLQGIAEGIPGVVAAAVDIIVAILETIGEQLPRIVGAGVQLIIDFVNGMAEQIREKTPEMVTAFKNLGSAMLEGIISALFAGIKGVVDTIKNVAKAIWNGFKDFFGIRSPSTLMAEGGRNIIDGLIGGLTGGIGKVVDKAKEIGGKLFDGIKDSVSNIKDVAGDVISGLSNGLSEGASTVFDGAKSLGGKLLGGIKGALGIESPSKEMITVGKYSGQGLVMGLESYSDHVTDSGYAIGNDLSNAISEGIDDSSPDPDIDLSPTIRPVIDMSAVEEGMAKTFGEPLALNVASIKDLAETICTKKSEESSSGGDVNTTNEGDQAINITNHYYVRDDSDINKINRGLDNIITKLNRSKGVIPT